MNPTSREQLEKWDREHVWHPFTPMQSYAGERPIIIQRGYGCMLVDLDGKEYIDGVSSLWVNVHGHRVPELDEAVRAQLGRIAHTTLLGLASPPSIELPERLLAERSDEVCAVVLEPLVQAAGGMLMSPPGYLRRVRELCDRHDVLLI